MRIHWVANLLVTMASCLAGKLAVAQQTAIAPLAPVVAQPALPVPDLEKALQTSLTDARRPPATPAAPTQSVQRIWPRPVCLLNSHIIVNGLDIVKPQDIEKVDIYKEPKQSTPMKWWSLTEHGIINIKLKPGVKLRLKTKSLAAIRRQLKLSGLVSFKLNGMRLEDESLRIADDSIEGFDVSETVVNIRLAPPKPAPPHTYPPGTILIRGVAGM